MKIVSLGYKKNVSDIRICSKNCNVTNRRETNHKKETNLKLVFSNVDHRHPLGRDLSFI